MIKLEKVFRKNTTICPSVPMAEKFLLEMLDLGPWQMGVVESLTFSRPGPDSADTHCGGLAPTMRETQGKACPESPSQRRGKDPSPSEGVKIGPT